MMNGLTDEKPPYKLVVLDVDSTLINEEVIELLAARAGVLSHVAEITERAMRGELDFVASLRARVSLLARLPESVFADALKDVTITRGVPELVSAVHAKGGKVGAVSGGFHEVLDALAPRIGLDFWRANRCEVIDGALTGSLVGPVIDARAKADSLSQWAAELGISLAQTVAIGDGANDLEMMKIAGMSIAFDAKPVVNDAADFVLRKRDLSLAIPLLRLDS